MGRVRTPALLGVLAASVLACTAPGGNTDTSGNPALAERVDALVAPLVAANEFSGAIVMVRGGTRVYSRGFGVANHAAGLDFTPDTAADGGSLAKTFTAAGIWWLADEGKVDLDAPVQRYVPEYPHPQTTVVQLLSHSNGLPPDYGFFDESFQPGQVRATAGMLAIVAGKAPQPFFVPGTQYEYSNLGFDAAALVIERVTGQSYEAFVQERFFSRLGLQSSFARPARFADWKGVRTRGYRWHEGAWEFNDSFDDEGFLGASNLYFSAADLARWGSANAAGDALPARVFKAGQQPLSVGGRPLHLTGLGWYCDGRMVRCNYTGHNAGSHSFLFWDRERDESVAFVSNSTLPAWKVAILQRELVNALAGRAPGENRKPEFLDLAGTTPAEIAGTYVSGDGPALTLAAVSGRELTVRLGNGP